jgi:hypothetical protein
LLTNPRLRCISTRLDTAGGESVPFDFAQISKVRAYSG